MMCARTMFVHLRDYVEHEMGASGWPELLREANLSARLYLPIKRPTPTRR
jgi:hypothetical protein